MTTHSPTTLNLKSFHPPVRILMGPGPSEVHPQVLAAQARPTIGHLDPAFVAMMDETKALLQYAFQTRNAATFPVSAPGSAGMEACFANLVEPGEKVVVCINGVFGARMKENVERAGGVAVVVSDDWGKPVDPQKLEDALAAHPDARLAAFVHAETSTGVESDAATLAQIAHRHDCLTIVDTVTSLGGIPVRVDEWGLDAVYAGTQKCLSAPPGLSPLTFSERALEKARKRKSRIQSWFLDITLIMNYWAGGDKRTYHHTAPINPLYGLHEALLMLHREGLENAWARHRRNHDALRTGLREIDLEFLVAQPHRLPQLNAVKVPPGVDDTVLRRRLLESYDLEIGAGLGALAGKIVRIGLMGQSSNTKNVMYCVGAMGVLLGRMRASALESMRVAALA
jgi:alanine-glyoxylate transaminase/serine-glyoxylate transaminase/serine-pyruvate transaminase